MLSNISEEENKVIDQNIYKYPKIIQEMIFFHSGNVGNKPMNFFEL